jgi:hypothetical protein
MTTHGHSPNIYINNMFIVPQGSTNIKQTLMQQICVSTAAVSLLTWL